MSTRRPVLSAENLRVGYGGKPVLLDVSVELKPKEVLCVIGHNGAGKSTLMRTLFGLTKPEAGPRPGRRQGAAAAHPARAGSARRRHGAGGARHLPGPDGRGDFRARHVVGGRAGRGARARVEWVMQVLPQVRNFYDKRAGLLSGGQQQMVSIGRALLARPRCLLMDEPSIGLAPKLFQDLLQPIRALQQQHGMSILLVEQNVREALKISDRVVVMKAGAIILDTVPSELKDNARLMELY